jgi:hypothetical protein
MAARTLEITFIGNPKPLQDAMSQVESSGGKLSAAMKGLGGTFTAVASTAAGFVLGGAIMKAPAALKGLSDLARDLELQMNKANIVFGDQIGVVQDWAKANAGAMGLTKNEATNLAAGLADLLIPMGMTREAAAQMSTRTIGLAGALAEWSGGAKSAAEVSAILTKAYLGETDGLKELGISISAADVSQRLLEKGQKDLTGSALEQAQALAIQELIFEKSTDAQKAFADGADSAARKKAEMTARIKEAKEALAMGLMPAFTAVTTQLATLAVPLFGAVGRAIDGISGSIESVVGVLKSLSQYLRVVVEDGDTLNDYLASLPGWMQPAAQAMGEFALLLKDTLIPAVMAGAAFVRDELIPLLIALGGEVIGALVATWEKDLLPKLQALGQLLSEHVLPPMKLLAEKALELGERALPPLREGLEQVIGFVRDHKEILVGLGVAITTVLVPSIWAWVAAEYARVSAHLAAAAAMVVANAPIVALVAGITALVAGIIWLVRNWDDLEKKYPAVKEASDNFRQGLEAVKTFIVDNLVPAIQSLTRWFNDNILPAMRAVADFIVFTLGPRLLDIAKWIAENIVPKVVELVTKFHEFHIKLAQEIIPPVLSLIQSIADKVIDIAGTISRWMGVVSDAFVSAKNAVEGPISTMLGWIQAIIDKVQDALGWLGKLPGVPGFGGGGGEETLRRLTGDYSGSISQQVAGGGAGLTPPPGLVFDPVNNAYTYPWAQGGAFGQRGADGLLEFQPFGSSVVVNITGDVYARDEAEARAAGETIGWHAALRARGLA